MIYVIRTCSQVHLIYEGIQQKIFEINGRAIHPVYPVDNLKEYIKEVEKVSQKNKHKDLNKILCEVDRKCAECMFVAEANDVSKIHYNSEFKDELNFTLDEFKIKNLTAPFQISSTFNGKTAIVYPPETEIIIPPENYKDFFGNFSEKKNKRNDKTYEMIRRGVTLFDNAYVATSIMCLLHSEPCRIDSFERFEKSCEEKLTHLEIMNEKYDWFKNSLSSGKHEEKSTYRGIPPCVDYILELQREFEAINDIWNYYGCVLKNGPFVASKRTYPDVVKDANVFLGILSSPFWLYYGWPLIKKGLESVL